MELIRGRHNLRPAHRDCAVTIGNFDGLHQGHRTVIERLKERATALGVPSCVVTFEPHPVEFFAPERAPARLARLRDKVAVLQELGVDRVFVLYCDAGLTQMAPQGFIDEILCDGLGARHLIIGDDFRFGHKRAGDFDTLAAAGEVQGFGVEAAPTYCLDGERVSSTRVRAALAAGDLEEAARLLGSRYTLRGRVVHGDHLGRQLGYPTANIALDGYPLALTGVLAVLAWTADGRRLPGVANLGWRPTVQGERPLLEVYVFDFQGDLYGKHLAVELVARLRGEERFDSLDAMVEQMHADARHARAVLGV